MNVNKCILVGRLTKDPELKTLPQGSVVASFSVATGRTWKDKDGKKQEETEFHNVVSFGKQAEIIAQYVKKGHELYVEGRLKTRGWQDANQVKHYRTEIVMEDFQFGAKPGGAGSNQAESPFSPKAAAAKTTMPVDPEIRKVAEAIPYPDDDIDVNDIPF